MSAEEDTVLLHLFDTYWFQQRAFSFKPSSLSTPQKAPFLPQEARNSAAADDDDKPKLTRISTTLRKSYSDQFLSSKDFSSESPNSVLGPRLQTILSGKEVESFNDSSSSSSSFSPNEDKISSGDVKIHDPKLEFGSKAERVRDRRRRRKRSESKSLSELEFQELKGFVDLGFVFSDEDKDSRLVSIIPGLQRLGGNVQKLSDNTSGGGFDGTTTSVSRPYLSEAWECRKEEERAKNPLMDWRIPAFGNEIELKHHLKFWAHAVASTVR